MKLTDALTAEHAVLRRLLDYADHRVEHWTLAELRAAGATIAGALLSHAAVEDDLLFSALAPQFGEQGPVAVMREEHEQIDQAFASLEQAPDAEQGRRALRRVTQLSRVHFAKEEAVLFHLAEHLLPVADLERLGKAWALRCNTAAIPHYLKEAS
ncbi:MAG: hemerythrin domain-containing protein [Acidobacteriota bacterium]